MAAGQDPRGVTAGLDETDKQLKSIFASISKSSKPTERDLKRLDVALVRLNKDTRTLKSSNDLLVATMAKLDRGTTTFRLGAMATAGKLAESSDLMTDAQEKAHSIQIDLIRDQISALQKVGGSHKEVALLDEKRGQLEMERFEGQKKTAIQLAALQVRQGERVKGTFNGMVAAAQLRGSQVGKMAGDIFGVSAKAMGAIAGIAGGALILFAALKTMIEQDARGAKDASAGGLELAGSYRQASADGRRYMEVVRRAGMIQADGVGQFISAIPSERVMELAAQAQKDYAFGMAGVGQQYLTTLGASREARNEIRLQTVEFAADMAKMSAVLGISDEEAVRLGTRLGVMSKGNFRQAEQAALALGMEAKRLGVPMGNLVSVFEILAAQADHAGSSTSRLTAETMAFTDSIKDMSAKGVRGLQNLDPEKMNRIATSMVQFMSQMQNNRLVALTMKPNEGLNASLDRLESGTMGMRRDAILSAMRLMGVGTDMKKMTSLDALKVAKAAGVEGDLSDQIRMGRFLAGSATSGALSEDSIKKRMAQITDSKFDQAKSVGANLAAGADVMQVIAGTLQNILRVIVEFANKAVFGGGTKTSQDLQRRFDNSGQGAGNAYQQRNDLYRSRPRAAGAAIG